MRLKLKVWSEPFAAALGAVLLDVPFDIMGVKLLWWSWHATDPYLFVRTYNVPWTRFVCVCVCVCVCDSDLKSLEMEIGRPGCETGRGLGVRLGEAWV